MPNVLIIDDDPDSLTIVGMILSRAGFDVNTALTGNAALKAASDSPAPDLVLLDTVMPDMSGYDICRQLLTQRPNLPVIFYTARTENAAVRAAKEAGAADYLIKPTSAAKLIDHIRQHLPQTT